MLPNRTKTQLRFTIKTSNPYLQKKPESCIDTERFGSKHNLTLCQVCFNMIKLGKGLQGDATCQISKLYTFQFKRRRILNFAFFVPMLELTIPRAKLVFTQGGIKICINLVEVHQEMLHAKYQSCMPSTFGEEDFLKIVLFLLFFAFLLPWQPELWMEFNSFHNFARPSPKEHPCQVSSRLAHRFRRRR